MDEMVGTHPGSNDAHPCVATVLVGVQRLRASSRGEHQYLTGYMYGTTRHRSAGSHKESRWSEASLFLPPEPYD